MIGKKMDSKIEIKDIILCSDAVEQLKRLSDESADMCLTSPPYFSLRNYDVDGQIGQEDSPDEYIARLLAVFAEVHRILKPTGTLWLNIGDTYAGSGQGAGTKEFSAKQKSNRGMTHMQQTEGFKSKLLSVDGCKRKDMIGIPWKLAFALRDAGWYLRQDIVWYKPNVMPEPVKDRCTKSYEHIFLFAKSEIYYFDHEAIREPRSESSQIGGTNGKRNARDVWQINTKPYRGAHFATFPEELANRCIAAGCPEGGVVLDPFMGAGTTAVAAISQGKHYIGVDLNPNYVALAEERIRKAKNTTNMK